MSAAEHRARRQEVEQTLAANGAALHAMTAGEPMEQRPENEHWPDSPQAKLNKANENLAMLVARPTRISPEALN